MLLGEKKISRLGKKLLLFEGNFGQMLLKSKKTKEGKGEEVTGRFPYRSIRPH